MPNYKFDFFFFNAQHNSYFKYKKVYQDHLFQHLSGSSISTPIISNNTSMACLGMGEENAFEDTSSLTMINTQD